MDLKKHLQDHLNSAIDWHKDIIKNGRSALRVLEKTNFKNATYVVKIHSLWEDHGTKSIVYAGTGNIETAIKRAESKFKRVNNCSTTEQTEYYVNIQLGKTQPEIPEEFWKRYIEKRPR